MEIKETLTSPPAGPNRFVKKGFIEFPPMGEIKNHRGYNKGLKRLLKLRNRVQIKEKCLKSSKTKGIDEGNVHHHQKNIGLGITCSVQKW
jgi:hypothetical protein